MSALASRQPWADRKLTQNIPAVIGSIIPAATAILIAVLAGLDFSFALIVIFLPLQLLSAAILGFRYARTRGVKDALLVFGSIFLSTNVFVLLISVLYAVVAQGITAMSPQFLAQNNVYVNTTTSLEYGGVGHAILGTLLIVLMTDRKSVV